MKIFIILFSFIITHNSLEAQNNDSIAVLVDNVWMLYLQSRWLDKDTFYLKSLGSIKSDYVNFHKKHDIILPSEDVDIIYSDFKYRDVITFDYNLNVTHDIYSTCLVGETLYEVYKFEYIKGKVKIHYTKKPWNREKKHFIKQYTILRWDVDYVILSENK